MKDYSNIIAGPCSVDTKELFIATVDSLYANGIRNIRGGIWKPRTKPGGFSGIGEKGLQWMKEAKEKYPDIKLATEVATEEHVNLAFKYGIDILWIGARTTTNPFAMDEIANAIFNQPEESKINKTLLIKNPICPDVDLWEGAYLRTTHCGIKDIGFIHRGFKDYKATKYRNDPNWKLPLKLKLKYPNIKMYNDPSHIAGERFYIEEIMTQAKSFNFDGYIIESHICPDKALSDANQQLTPDKLADILNKIYSQTPKELSKDQLAIFRKEIDEIDTELISLLSKRMEVSKEIGKVKKENNIQIFQPERLKSLISNLIKIGNTKGLSSKFVENVWMEIHDESIKNQ